MATGDEEVLRQRAIRRLKKKAEFRSHVSSYLLVNAMLVAIWAFTGGGYFWPVWPLLGWGIGIAFHGWEAYASPRSALTEDRIQREIDRLRRG